MILAPALTMYVVVSTGAGWLRFWYFTTSYSPRGVMLTIGLLYSAVLNPFVSLFRQFIPNQPWVFVTGVALGGAVLGTFVDIFLLHARLLPVKSKHYPVGSNAIRHDLSYGPVFFGFVGLVNALGFVYGYRQLSQNSTTLAVVVMCVAVSAVFVHPETAAGAVPAG